MTSKPPPPAGPPSARGEETPANRKLIRPVLASHAGNPLPRTATRRREPPPAETFAEGATHAKWIGDGTPLAVTLESGEVLHGVLEWQDRDAIKLRRRDAPGPVVMKHAIVHVAPDTSVRRE